MHRFRHYPSVIQFLVVLTTLALFTTWYRGGERLRPAEIDTLMDIIEAQSPAVLGGLDTDAFRRFLETDDGLPFFNLNLFKYRETAAYPEGSEYAGSGRAAFKRYAEFMISALPGRACHVTFAGIPIANTEWDQIAVARYRSRRDLAELFASREFSTAVVNKWAALDGNLRIPLQSRYWFAPAYALVALMTMGIIAALRALWTGLRYVRRLRE